MSPCGSRQGFHCPNHDVAVSLEKNTEDKGLECAQDQIVTIALGMKDFKFEN